MSETINPGNSDDCIVKIEAVLCKYRNEHAGAQTKVYRQNPASVRIRIIDPGFANADRVQRDDAVWQYLDKLPAEVQSDISMLVLLTPEETETSLANLEFDDPVRSRL